MNNKIINLIIILLIFLIIYYRIISINEDIYINILSSLNIIIILVSSLYFSFKLKFIQFNIFKMYKTIISSTKDDLKALFMSLGAKIGVGSIIGISLAINNKGPGVILWIWIISLLSSILSYVETYLGLLYRNNNKGGVFYYIKEGLNNNTLAIIYTIILIIVYLTGFIGIQSNTIINITNNVTNINKYLLIILVCIIITIIIFNSTNNIINSITKIVPIMCLLYITLCIFIIIPNINKIKNIFKLIIIDGLKYERIIDGTIIVGLQRGIFATESGIGTSSIASNIGEYKKETQGLFQVLGIHFISLIIITLTSIILILNNNYLYSDSINNILYIFTNYLGIIGKVLYCIIIILFAISTIISGYYYSIKGLEFIKGELDIFDKYILKISVLLIIVLSSLIKSSIIWDIIDDLISLLLFINIYSLITLRKKVINNNYYSAT